MKLLDIPCLSVKVLDNEVLALGRAGSRIVLCLVDLETGNLDEVVSFEGSRGFILVAHRGRYLVNVDNAVYLVEDGKPKLVLKASRLNNVFWHGVEAENRVFLQEYGESPTGIYVSENFVDWRKLVTNIDIDRKSRHFHYIAYDPYRRWLIATLGDGCITRVVISQDLGETWKPLYKGPWQFVPVVPLRDKIVFGMDSGIAKGGLGIYYPSKNRWKFVFLKWQNMNIPCQMNDLLRAGDLWIAALGMPQAVVASKDSKTWRLVYLESMKQTFNSYMKLDFDPIKKIIVCSTGGRLLVMRYKDLLKEYDKYEVSISEYNALFDRLKGLSFTLKHRLLCKVFSSIR